MDTLPTTRPWSPRLLKIGPQVTPGAGRGLFTLSSVEKGELLERAVTNVLEPAHCVALDEIHPVGDFYFQHPERPDSGLLVFGLISLCNHQEVPTAQLRFVREGTLGLVAELIAAMDLPEGAELTLRYKCALWFEPR